MPSQSTRSVTAKTLYLIRVAGYNGDVGSPTLTITGPECSIPDEAAPSPNPMTLAGGPLVLGGNSVRLTATLAADTGSPPVKYFFERVAPGLLAANSNWIATRIYTAAGLSPNTVCSFRVKAWDSETPPNETGFSDSVTATTLMETPGLAFGTVTPTSIELHAAGNLANLDAGDSGVIFECRTATDVARAGVWTRQTSAVASGLTPDTEYMFQVKARNRAGGEAAGGTSVSMRTLANVPGAATLTMPQPETLQPTIDPNGNPPSTFYAIQCMSTEPTDAAWADKLVGPTGLANHGRLECLLHSWCQIRNALHVQSESPQPDPRGNGIRSAQHPPGERSWRPAYHGLRGRLRHRRRGRCAASPDLARLVQTVASTRWRPLLRRKQGGPADEARARVGRAIQSASAATMLPRLAWRAGAMTASRQRPTARAAPAATMP